MEKQQPFSCFIFGTTTLPIHCATHLLEQGHQILGVVTLDPIFKKWAIDNNVPYFSPDDDFLAATEEQPFDYLFSIINETILPTELLQQPRYYAINYHDAPLPRYAGMHATSWAIINQEPRHAVTWHVMTELIDGGNILKQAAFEIAPDDTAITLNAKCYDTAITLFQELTAELATRQAHRQPQDLSQRTYFSLYKRPPAAAIINWADDAATINALIRGLDFGTYRNPLGLPKLWLNDTCLIINDMVIGKAQSTTEPGTVLNQTPTALHVSCASHTIELRQLSTLSGHIIPMNALSKFTSDFKLSTRKRLPLLTAPQRERINTINEQLARHESFWARRLYTLKAVTLPYTNPAPTELNPNYTTYKIRLPAPTRNQFLLTAFLIYLARLNNTTQFDIAYSHPTLKKHITGWDSLFASFVPLHVEIDLEQPFATAEQRVQTELDYLTPQLTYARDLVARSPMLKNRPDLQQNEQPLPLAISLLKAHEPPTPAPHAALTLALDGAGELCYWLYDPRQLPAAALQRVVAQFETFMQAILAQPDQPLMQQTLLPQSEREELLYGWNQTQADYPAACLHHLFEAQAARTPDALALLFADEQLTYRQLNERVNQLAHHLQQLTVSTETLVGICVERSVEMIVGILAVLKAGGAYVPLDPAYPAERIEFMIEDAQMPVLLTQQALVETLPPHAAHVVSIDSDWPQIAQHPPTNPTSPTQPHHLAYVIYTSGSTGKPKGVAISHNSAATLIHWATKIFTPESLSGMLASTSMCFDLSVFEFFLPLSGGNTIILVENILQLPTLNPAKPVTLINTVPSAINELVKIKGIPASVQVVNLAGEPLKNSLAQAVYESQPSVQQVFNLYGPSEDTTYSTYKLVEKGALGEPTIGRPIANTQAYILDTNRRPVPQGVIGELYLAGDGLAREYLNRPQMTAQRFVPNPFSNTETDSPARMYKTGDLCRYRPDSEIEFMGRIDHQVKIRGFRIELGEIEATLTRHPAIEEAAVIAHGDNLEEKRLVAYLMPTHNETPTVGQLRQFLEKTLPDYMLPALFVTLEAFPLTPNGKIDRKALPEPNTARLGLGEPFVPPETPTQQKLAALWADILDIEQVGLHDNFFELGGHSLLATQVISRIPDLFEVNIPLRTFFENPTVMALAKRIETLMWATTPQTTPTTDFEATDFEEGAI